MDRVVVAPVACGVGARRLIGGTERFAAEAVVAWHEGGAGGAARDVGCYRIADVMISGAGQVWVDGALVTSPDIMPPYLLAGLGIAEGGTAALRHCANLPVRTIEAPCLVAVGAATATYGHFLLEILFQILIARRAYPARGPLPYRVLLDVAAPDWLKRILQDDLGIAARDMVFFAPWQERVRLREALVPTRVFLDRLIHPFANVLIDDLVAELGVRPAAGLKARIFVARAGFRNPAGSRRICVNEARLVEIAVGRFGFTKVLAEALPWRAQIELFHNAQIAVGAAGSALHNALFGRAGSRVASIGMLGWEQSEIGALRGQDNAFLTAGIDPFGEYMVDEAVFEAFLTAVCAGM